MNPDRMSADRLGLYDYSFTKIETITSGSWTSGHSFEFPGSDSIGAPKTIEVIGGKIDSNGKLTCRLYDVTNAIEIASFADFEGYYPSVIDFGTLANISADKAIWEVQFRNSGSNNKAVAVASLHMRF